MVKLQISKSIKTFVVVGLWLSVFVLLYLLTSIFVSFFVIIGVFLHELGHYIVARHFKTDPIFSMSGVDFCIKRLSAESRRQENFIHISGLIFTIPLLTVSYLFLKFEWWSIYIFLTFIVGSLVDITAIIRNCR